MPPGPRGPFIPSRPRRTRSPRRRPGSRPTPRLGGRSPAPTRGEPAPPGPAPRLSAPALPAASAAAAPRRRALLPPAPARHRRRPRGPPGLASLPGAAGAGGSRCRGKPVPERGCCGGMPVPGNAGAGGGAGAGECRRRAGQGRAGRPRRPRGAEGTAAAPLSGGRRRHALSSWRRPPRLPPAPAAPTYPRPDPAGSDRAGWVATRAAEGRPGGAGVPEVPALALAPAHRRQRRRKLGFPPRRDPASRRLRAAQPPEGGRGTPTHGRSGSEHPQTLCRGASPAPAPLPLTLPGRARGSGRRYPARPWHRRVLAVVPEQGPCRD